MLAVAHILFFKELIQNAEDAGASQVKFLYDKHSYGKKKLHHEKLATFQVRIECSVSGSFLRDKQQDLTISAGSYLTDSHHCYRLSLMGCGIGCGRGAPLNLVVLFPATGQVFV